MFGLDVGDSLFRYEEGNIHTGSLQHVIETAANDGGETVRFKSVIAQEDPKETLGTVGERLKKADVSVSEYSDFIGISLDRVIEREDIEDGQRTVSGSFAMFPDEETEIWTAVTGPDADFYERGLRWLLKQAEPRISSMYATSRDLRWTISRLEESLPPEIGIVAKKTVAYSRTEEGNISYESRPFREAFEVAAAENRLVDKITFEVTCEDDTLLTAFLSRDGQSKFLGGQSDHYFSTLLPTYASFAQEKTDVLKDKERSRNTGDVHPIELTFENDIFTRTEDNVKLIDSLEDLSDSNVTVYHQNPYAHLSVLDLIDGSSCDVFVTDSDEVMLVPSYKGSLNSLMRIAEKLSREIDEASIGEQQQNGPEFGAFFA